ncbi:hypothetical protein [Nocardiopsis suaedae]|uniref:LPXTG cell wall anchor domain-containing protein n=1 Tax=Nocardiopsis suaedae TaxID=3018444 RepID=A0ABT4TT24_9ACTN|nr:hypothetical protein [Nocardiopsis suaedae]MDA2807849.1 hypothetical protein [Nocardiopsis suaedae]
MSPRIATGLAAVAAVIAAGSGPAWADVPEAGTPEAEPSASAAAPPSASPSAERSPGHAPSVSPSPSPTQEPSSDATDPSAPDDGPGGRSPEPSPGPDGPQTQKDGDDGADGDGGEEDADGSDDAVGAPFELDDLKPDDLGGHVAEVDYVCTLPDGGTTDETFLWSAWALPEDPVAGEGVQIGAVFAGDYFWLLDERGKPVDADGVTETGTVRLGGKAAAEDAVDTTVRADPGDGPFGLDWDFDGTAVQTTPERAGRLTVTPGDVRLAVESGGREAVTDCTPAKAVDPLLELKVAEAETEEDGAAVDGGAAAAAGNGTVSTPLGDLPVTGPALLGLAAAGAVSVGAGGTAMFLARKRPGADD